MGAVYRAARQRADPADDGKKAGTPPGKCGRVEADGRTMPARRNARIGVRRVECAGRGRRGTRRRREGRGGEVRPGIPVFEALNTTGRTAKIPRREPYSASSPVSLRALKSP